MNDLVTRTLFADGWLQLPPELPFEMFQAIVEKFADFHKDLMWIAGDLQIQGKALYGEDYSQVLDVLAGTKYTESTLGVARAVAEKYPIAERRAVSFEHHKMVMKRADRAAWLDRAFREQLTTAQMRTLIAEGDVSTRKDESPNTKVETSTSPSSVSVLGLLTRIDAAHAQFDYVVADYRRKILHDAPTDGALLRLGVATKELLTVLAELDVLCA
jgi:hypothetical protein